MIKCIAILFVFQLQFILNGYSQMNCKIVQIQEDSTNTNLTNNLNSLVDCSDINTYLTLSQNTPKKDIRFAFHVFQKDDGTGNIQDTPANRQWLSNFVWPYLNNPLSNLSQMWLPTSSPFMQDSKVNFVLDNIYFWKDSYVWDGSNQNNPTPSHYAYTNYVLNQSIVTNKYTTLPVFLTSTPGGGGGGGHATIGFKNFAMINAMYLQYNNNTPWVAGGILKHELCHNLGLPHSWGQSNTFNGDFCDDTPVNPNCWDGTQGCTPLSNNIMDYNNSQSALTRCQINTIHYFLLGNLGIDGDIHDCVIGGVNVTVPIVSGSTSICNPNGSTYIVDNLQLGVTVNATATPSTLFQNANICGGPSILFKSASTTTSGGAILTFTTGFGKYGSTSTTKKVWVGTRPAILNVCTFPNNPQIYGATTINSPGSGCTTATVPLNQDVTFIAGTINLNGGFEVPLGSSFEAIPEIIACQ